MQRFLRALVIYIKIWELLSRSDTVSYVLTFVSHLLGTGSVSLMHRYITNPQPAITLPCNQDSHFFCTDEIP